MGCFLEVGLAVWGLYLLVTGEAKMPAGKPARGPLVRVAGFIFMMPLPLAFLVGFGLGISAGIKGQTSLAKSDAAALQLMELGLIFGCLVIGCGMLFFASLSQPEPKRDPFFQDRLLCDYDRIFETPTRPEQSISELDEVIPVAPRPLGPEQKHGITAERPIPSALARTRKQRPNMGPAKGDGAILAKTDGERRADAAADVVPAAKPLTSPGTEPPKSRTQDVLMIVAAAVIFVVVAWAGSALMSSSGAAPASASIGR